MSSIVIAGNTSGSVTLQAPAVAGSTTLTLPATSGTLALTSGITPAGSDTQVQYNNAGAFGASSAFTFNSSSLLQFGDSTAASRIQVRGSTTLSKGVGFQCNFSGASYGGVYWDAGSDSMIFESKVNVEMLRLNTNGNMALKGGTTTATGVGVTFPATQSASTDANCLDDYEEGTWTPSIGGTATYNEAVGNYVKVGKMVTVNADIWIASIGTGSAGTVSGLPFTKASGYNQGCYTYYWNALSVSITNLYPWIDTTTVKFHTVGAAATGVNNTINILQNNARVQFTAVYYV